LVEVVAIGVLVDAEPELMSVGVDVEPEAPIEVPLPVVEPVVEPMPVEAPAVVSVLPVLGVVPIEPLVLPAAVVLLGVVLVEGSVLELEEEVDVSVDGATVSSFLPQALRDRAAIRARAAHCAIGDLIIGNS
jgi:hypothetical protein